MSILPISLILVEARMYWQAPDVTQQPLGWIKLQEMKHNAKSVDMAFNAS